MLKKKINWGRFIKVLPKYAGYPEIAECETDNELRLFMAKKDLELANLSKE